MLSYVAGPSEGTASQGFWETAELTAGLPLPRRLAGSQLLPGDESDRRPAADVPERGGRLLGPVTAADQSETRHAR